MKKNFSFTLLTLFLTIFSFVIFPVKVFADSIFDGTAEDWFNHISQFDYSGYGFARCEIYQTQVNYWYEDFGLLILDEPLHEVEGCIFEYSRGYSSEYWVYFKPSLGSFLKSEIRDDYSLNIVELLESQYYDFDGYLYWNFEEGYWQVEYYGTTELDYYIQRIDELEDEISLLEDEISLLEDEIQRLEDTLENNVSFNYDIIKWFVPLVIIIILVAVIKPIISIKRRDE